MKKPKRRRWKRRVLWAASILTLLTGILVALVFTRFHFSHQVILFGTYEVLQEYKDSGYSLGYTPIWKNFGNRLRVLFTPGEIINRCENIGCDYLVLPIIFANQSLINAANSKDFIGWTYGSDDERDLEHSAGRGVSGLIVDRPKVAVEYLINDAK